MLYNEKINCDTLVPESTRNVWDKLVETSHHSEKIIILKPWFDVYDENCFYEVHRFADVPSEAYSIIIYLRCAVGNSNPTTLLCSKSRLAPSKYTTIPGLEMSVCVQLSFELVKSVILVLSKQISIKNVYCWSDSLIPLCWLNNIIKLGSYRFRIELRKFVNTFNTELCNIWK